MPFPSGLGVLSVNQYFVNAFKLIKSDFIDLFLPPFFLSLLKFLRLNLLFKILNRFLHRFEIFPT